MVSVEVISPCMFHLRSRVQMPKREGEQWEVSPGFGSPLSSAGSPSGCPKCGLLPCAFKGADFSGSLVPVKWSQVVLPCPPLGLLWKAEMAQHTQEMTGGGVHRDARGPWESLRRSESHSPKAHNGNILGEGHVLSTLKASTMRPSPATKPSTLWKPVSQGTSQLPEAALQT